MKMKMLLVSALIITALEARAQEFELPPPPEQFEIFVQADRMQCLSGDDLKYKIINCGYSEDDLQAKNYPAPVENLCRVVQIVSKYALESRIDLIEAEKLEKRLRKKLRIARKNCGN